MPSPRHAGFQAGRDFYGGLLMVLIGGGAVLTALSYPLGTLANMGPGFYPFILGVLLALTGLAIALSGLSRRGGGSGEARSEKLDRRGGLCILLGTLAFPLLGLYGGLVPATFATVFIAALGDRGNRWRDAILLALSMTAIAIVVFWWALQVQIPLFRWGG